MTAAARRRQRTGSKTDPGDALAIARVGLREHCLPPPRPDGAIEELRRLVRYRRELVADRTRQINQLHADLEQLRPGYHHGLGRLGSPQLWTVLPDGCATTKAPEPRSPAAAPAPAPGSGTPAASVKCKVVRVAA